MADAADQCFEKKEKKSTNGRWIVRCDEKSKRGKIHTVLKLTDLFSDFLSG